MQNSYTAQLETLHVFIDTNIFRGKLFNLNNWSLDKLGQLGQERKIHLHSTSFAIREVEKNIVGHINEVFANTKKMNVHLRNAELPELEITAIKEGRLAKWREFINESNTDILDFPAGAIEEVFGLYFDSKPPFKNNAEKKHEFPDAFILVALKFWCEENKEAMYVVTEDELFRKACEGTRLLPLQKLEEFLDLCNKREPFLYKTALDCFEELNENIKNGIKETIEGKWYDVPDLWDSDISDLEVNDLELHTPLVIDADEESCRIDVDADIYVSAQIHYADPDLWYRDDETKEMVSLQQHSENITGSFSVTASIQITFDLSEHPRVCDLHSVVIPGRITFRLVSERLYDRYEVASSD